MLFQLLKSVGNWVSDFLLTNHWSDKEAQIYFEQDENESNEI
jgi:hypothetical protein